MAKIVAKALVRNSKELYLVLYRSNTHPLFPGHIDFPGGEVEPEETSEAAGAREIQEETVCLFRWPISQDLKYQIHNKVAQSHTNKRRSKQRNNNLL